MGTALAPSHLLSLDKSLTQNLVDGRTIRDGLSSSQAGIRRHLVMAKLVDRIFHRVRQHPFRQTAGVQLLQNLRKILRHLKMI